MELCKEFLEAKSISSTDKKTVRKQLLLQRNNLPLEYRKQHSARICESLWTVLLQRSVKVIHVYISMGSELETSWLIKMAHDYNMTVVVPKVLHRPKMVSLRYSKGEGLKRDKFGTFVPEKEQIYDDLIDAVVVPGLAFEKNGYRLGYGGGFYDYFLSNNPSLFSSGICYPSQLYNILPLENHDVQVKKIFC